MSKDVPQKVANIILTTNDYIVITNVVNQKNGERVPIVSQISDEKTKEEIDTVLLKSVACDYEKALWHSNM